MVNTAKRYFLYNGGDCAALVIDPPDDVICVLAGPDPQIEAHRMALIAEMGCGGPSCYPALYWHQAAHEEVDAETGDPITIPDRWRELRVADLPKPWTWDAINAAHAAAAS